MSTPKTATISATHLQKLSGQIIRRVAQDGEHIIVERGQYPMMVIIPLKDYQQLMQTRHSLSHNELSHKGDD